MYIHIYIDMCVCDHITPNHYYVYIYIYYNRIHKISQNYTQIFKLQIIPPELKLILELRKDALLTGKTVKEGNHVVCCQKIKV